MFTTSLERDYILPRHEDSVYSEEAILIADMVLGRGARLIHSMDNSCVSYRSENLRRLEE